MQPPRYRRLRLFQSAATIALIASLMGARALAAPPIGLQGGQPHNVIFFVPDGLRATSVDAHNTPEFSALEADGVTFTNTHALFPTLTTPNASAFATGHFIGDTGDFGDTVFTTFPLVSLGGTTTPFLEDDAVLTQIDDHAGGNYLGEASVLSLARRAGYETAAVGEIGATAIEDLSALRPGSPAIIVDEDTGRPGGVPLSARTARLFRHAGVSLVAPARGGNDASGTASEAGTHVADIEQERYFSDVATNALLPYFARAHRPFAMVFWSRDPNDSQHNQHDSLHRLWPGINGPTSLAGVRDADTALGKIRAKLHELGLDQTTDVIVAADHGFSTISKQSNTSFAAAVHGSDSRSVELPPGFLAMDLSHALHLNLYDSVPPYAQISPASGKLPPHGSALIGPDSSRPQMLVVANGGSDLLYFIGHSDTHQFAVRVANALAREDYTSGIFTADRLGNVPGALPLQLVNLTGSALMPQPSMFVSFRSFGYGCPDELRCAVEVADTGLQQGQGMYGGFNRSDTRNFVAAAGPDFQAHAVDRLPVSNADIGATVAYLLHLQLPDHENRAGRVLEEAFQGAPAVAPVADRAVVDSSRSAGGQVTEIRTQEYGGERYIDAAGFPGRTLGL